MSEFVTAGISVLLVLNSVYIFIGIYVWHKLRKAKPKMRQTHDRFKEFLAGTSATWS